MFNGADDSVGTRVPLEDVRMRLVAGTRSRPGSRERMMHTALMVAHNQACKEHYIVRPHCIHRDVEEEHLVPYNSLKGFAVVLQGVVLGVVLRVEHGQQQRG